MGHSNYKLTDEQKVLLDRIAKELESDIGDKCAHHEILDPYAGREFDNNKFTAMVWYIGDQLSSY